MKICKKYWWLPALLAAVLIIYVLCSFNLESYNFGVVTEGRLYRSAQPDEEFLEELVAKYSIKTIVVLTRRVPEFEKQFAQKQGIKIYHFPMKASREPSAETVNEFLKIIQDQTNWPILIHCSAGADRTGVLIAVKRVELDGWTLEGAINEMKYYRHLPFFQPAPTDYLRKLYGQIKLRRQR